MTEKRLFAQQPPNKHFDAFATKNTQILLSIESKVLFLHKY
jgi:hypothetical protein